MSDLEYILELRKKEEDADAEKVKELKEQVQKVKLDAISKVKYAQNKLSEAQQDIKTLKSTIDTLESEKSAYKQDMNDSEHNNLSSNSYLLNSSENDEQIEKLKSEIESLVLKNQMLQQTLNFYINDDEKSFSEQLEENMKNMKNDDEILYSKN
jgi:flagellar biosynthesis chaperone FliJ